MICYQMKILKMKHPLITIEGKECRGEGLKHTINPYKILDCNVCQGTGKATIEIKKEWVEIPHKDCEGKTCLKCGGDGIFIIPKYKVGDEIALLIYDDGRQVLDDYGGKWYHII